MRSILGLPRAFQLCQALLGSTERYRRFLEDTVRARPGDRVLDIGCGTADVLDLLPDVRYHGFDPSAAYIAAARERHGARGRFTCARVEDFTVERSGYDIALAIGVLHHLDDEQAEDAFRVAQAALVPGGRLVTLDGCYTDDQSRIARWLLSCDRGRHVRTAAGYRVLAESVFSDVEAKLWTDILRVPYTHVSLCCTSVTWTRRQHARQ